MILKAVIISDEFGFASDAHAALRRVGRHEGAGVQWAVKYWPVNALQEGTMADDALAESLGAHLIAFPEWLASRFPHWLRNWLERWASLRRIEDAALGVIKASGSGGVAAACAALAQFVRAHGLCFVAAEDFAANNRVDFAVGLSPSLMTGPLLRQPRLAHGYGWESFRGLGINE